MTATTGAAWRSGVTRGTRRRVEARGGGSDGGGLLLDGDVGVAGGLELEAQAVAADGGDQRRAAGCRRRACGGPSRGARRWSSTRSRRSCSRPSRISSSRVTICTGRAASGRCSRSNSLRGSTISPSSRHTRRVVGVDVARPGPRARRSNVGTQHALRAGESANCGPQGKSRSETQRVPGAGGPRGPTLSGGGRRPARRARSRAPAAPGAAGSRTGPSGSRSAVAWSTMTRLRRATAVSRAAMLTGGPKTSPSRITTDPVASPTRTSGIRASRPTTVDDPLGGVVGPDRVLVHEQHRVADALDHPAALAGDDVGAARLEDLDQVADPVVVELVGQRGEADDVGEPDRHLRGVEVLLVGARAPRPGATAAARCRRQA